MRKSKVTATKCLGGKRHRWRHIAMHGEHETRWCPRCGCLTGFLHLRRVCKNTCLTRLAVVRCKDDDGGWYVEIPENLK